MCLTPRHEHIADDFLDSETYPKVIYNIYAREIDDLLSDTNRPTDKVENTLAYITVGVGEHQYRAILDCGAEVSLISKDMFDTIQESSKLQIKQLPVLNLTLVGFNGVKNRTPRVQVQLDVQIGQQEVPMVFIIVEGIITPILVGCDILRQLKAVIDFQKQEAIFKVGTVYVKLPFEGELSVNQIAKIRHFSATQYASETAENNEKLMKKNEISSAVPNKEEEDWRQKMIQLNEFRSEDGLVTMDQKNRLENIAMFSVIIQDVPKNLFAS